MFQQPGVHPSHLRKEDSGIKTSLLQQIVLGIKMISYESYGTILPESAVNFTTKQFIFSGLMIHSCAVCTILLNIQLWYNNAEEIGFDSVFHSFIPKKTLPTFSHQWKWMSTKAKFSIGDLHSRKGIESSDTPEKQMFKNKEDPSVDIE